MHKTIWEMAKNCFTNQRGSLNMAMGTDLFATLLLVFIISTAILLKAPKDGAASKAIEAKTPDISLPQSKDGGLSKERDKLATSISAKRNAEGSVEFYVGDKKTPLDGIAGLLKGSNSVRVELRLAESLTNGVTVNILNQLQEAGVKEISYIFTKTGGNHD